LNALVANQTPAAARIGSMLSRVGWRLLRRLGVVAHAYPPRYRGQESIPDLEFYRPSEHGDWLFSPWKAEGELRGYGDFHPYLTAALAATASTPERLYTLYTLARQALHLPGDFIETGVWKGGTAILFAKLIHEHSAPGRKLHLFDTFSGMPSTHDYDAYYKGGEFADTSVEAVRAKLPHTDFVSFHPGLVPDTFKGCENLRFAFAHIDLDIYQSILSACEFIYPRLVTGGVIIFDDYAWSTCPGARRAVDEFFACRTMRPLVLSNGQALVFKSSPEE
jgi:O-methyltransferase